jgi:hypothetical protein
VRKGRRERDRRRRGKGRGNGGRGEWHEAVLKLEIFKVKSTVCTIGTFKKNAGRPWEITGTKREGSVKLRKKKEDTEN